MSCLLINLFVPDFHPSLIPAGNDVLHLAVVERAMGAHNFRLNVKDQMFLSAKALMLFIEAEKKQPSPNQSPVRMGRGALSSTRVCEGKG